MPLLYQQLERDWIKVRAEHSTPPSVSDDIRHDILNDPDVLVVVSDEDKDPFQIMSIL